MAYTSPTTRATDYVFTATTFQSDVTDDIKWLAEDKPRARVYNSSAISITTSGTAQILTFNSERFDTGGMHSTVSNTSRLTIPTGGSGIYWIGGNVRFAANATGVRTLEILANGVSVLAQISQNANSAGATMMQIHLLYALNAADYVELRVNQTSGGALNVEQASPVTPEFYATWVSI